MLLPDQDLIQLDIARAKIRSKIDLSDAYEQVRIVPSNMQRQHLQQSMGHLRATSCSRETAMHHRCFKDP
jgi:hypothetical protein